MKIVDLTKYTSHITGQDAFERDHLNTIVVFETEKGIYKYWNPEPGFEEDYYMEKAPWIIEGIAPEDFKEEGYHLPELAMLFGIYDAWGFDL